MRLTTNEYIYNAIRKNSFIYTVLYYTSYEGISGSKLNESSVTLLLCGFFNFPLSPRSAIRVLLKSVSTLAGILTGSENVGGNLAQVANLNLANLLNIGRNAGPVPSSNANATVGSGGSYPDQSGYSGQGF